MAEDLGSRTAIVIGGTGALGRAVCEQLSVDGFDIAFTYRSNEQVADEVARRVRQNGRRVHAEKVDIREVDMMHSFANAVVDELGLPDCVVYASGPRFELGFVATTQPAAWSDVVDVDVKGFFNVLHGTLPHLRKRGRASIVAITTSAVDRPPALDSMSAAPKAAVQALVRSVAVEEGHYGIRANCVAPGFIADGFGKEILDEMLSAERKAEIIRSIPLERLGTPQEVANAVAFLCSDKASYVTGTTLFVSGGFEL